MSDNNRTIVEVQHLSKSFGPREILKDINFTVKKGDVTTIIGPSGSGKSTLLRCLNLLETPTSGDILFHGQNIEKTMNIPAYRSKVGMVFQSFNLFSNMTVLQNCMVGQEKVLRRDKETARQKAMTYLQKVGMAEYINARPRQLSGGQQQRVALARMLAAQPNATLLDEPFSALDANLREGLQLELQSTLARFGGPAILVSHDRDEIYRLCENTVVMEQGKVVACGNTKELFHSPKSVTAAKLTGCKNILSAKKQGDHSIFLPDWNHTLQTRWVVPDGLMGIGIRAHDFSPNGQENPIPVELTQQMEDPFFFTFRFSVNNCSLPLWWKVSKHTLSSEKPMLPNTLYLDSDAILPLCQP